MSTEELQQASDAVQDTDTPMQDDEATGATPTSATAPTLVSKKRPRLDLSARGGGERKTGKSMFGLLLNTLNKAKAEDKERNASEAAKKRQLIEKRLQNKLKKETDSVRQAEEAKKEKLVATRKEEDLQLKDSLYKLRRTRFPQLSNFLLTSDIIPSRESESSTTDSFQLTALLPTRSHPPPLYYLPAILTPEQEEFLENRKAQLKEAAEKDWENFKAERTEGIEEILVLRRKVAEQEEKKRDEAMTEQNENENGDDRLSIDSKQPRREETRESEAKDTEMEVDDGGKEERDKAAERKDERLAGDDDDAVEY